MQELTLWMVLILSAALHLAVLLFLVVTPIALVSLKVLGVIQAPWPQVWKHCRTSAIIGAVCLVVVFLNDWGLFSQ